MSHKSRRQSHCLNAAKQRCSNETCASIGDSSFSMDIDDEIEADENSIFRNMIQIYNIADIFEFCYIFDSTSFIPRSMCISQACRWDDN